MMDALHEKGLITEPHGRQESVFLTDEGLRRAEDLAVRLFGSSGSVAPEHR
jgi:predicted transcriptional regulator